ncbi:uncharacterized protein LOC132720763 [Ruditapes philippinarum]|uniref:uncharacterized protein LOC132720763 n=1 Tax=Ruditapes philippinarum TaxID=129788 RepID=UPI00295AA524|nr:uncharacterized protein LOC132720763 [Ruditapes philippinarum]
MVLIRMAKKLRFSCKMAEYNPRTNGPCRYTLVPPHSQNELSALVVSGQRKDKGCLHSVIALGNNPSGIPSTGGYCWYDDIVTLHPQNILSELVISGNIHNPEIQQFVMYGDKIVKFTRSRM